MSRKRADIEVEELNLALAKEEYLLGSKKISRAELFAVAGFKPLPLIDSKGRYCLVGPHPGGRYMLIGIEADEGHNAWRVVTACWVNAKTGKKIYEGGL